MSPLNLFAEYLVTRLEAASPWSAADVPRLLMYGVHDGSGSKCDITIGPVDAVNYIGGGESTVWYDEFAPIGFFENGEKKSSPNHE